MRISNDYFRADIPDALARAIDGAAGQMDGRGVIRRIWSGDWKVWKDEDKEISNRLGWLRAPELAAAEAPAWLDLAAKLRAEGTKRVILLGMGGSSLAAEAFGRILGRPSGAPELTVLDTTAPEAVLEVLAGTDIARTMFIVSSKSGTTAESNAFLAFFYGRALEMLGPVEAGRRFAAVTDPGTALEDIGRKLGFRAVIHGRKDVGGRFSALTAFGLFPAACAGLDIGRLIASGAGAAEACRREPAASNPGAMLGLLLAVPALQGKDKLMVVCPEELKPIFDWLEQLTAESTGKEGRGIVPVRDISPAGPAGTANDRQFVEFAGGAGGRGARISAVPAGSPLTVFELRDPYDLGGIFFVWETAIAVAGHVLGVNPFDQPDVETTKKKTREFLSSGAPVGAAVSDQGAGIDGGREALKTFLGQAAPGDYAAIQAFLPPSPDMAGAMDALAAKVAARTGLPVTTGFGPRYLHSTGQLHKGGPAGGLFIQIVPDVRGHAPIPEVAGLSRPAPSFETLIAAQSLGDLTALREKGRRVLRLRTARPDAASLAELSARILP